MVMTVVASGIRLKNSKPGMVSSLSSQLSQQQNQLQRYRHQAPLSRMCRHSLSDHYHWMSFRVDYASLTRFFRRNNPLQRTYQCGYLLLNAQLVRMPYCLRQDIWRKWRHRVILRQRTLVHHSDHLQYRSYFESQLNAASLSILFELQHGTWH